jgi:hypothetical protein
VEGDRAGEEERVEEGVVSLAAMEWEEGELAFVSNINI